MIIDDNGAVVLHRDFTKTNANIKYSLLVHKVSLIRFVLQSVNWFFTLKMFDFGFLKP